jgi:hypothetical protein
MKFWGNVKLNWEAIIPFLAKLMDITMNNNAFAGYWNNL